MRRALIVAIAIAFAGAALVVALRGGDDVDTAADSSMHPDSSMPASPPASESSEAAPAREVTVRIGEMYFKPDQGTLKAGKVTVKARNLGAVEHDVVMVKTDLPADQMPMTHEGGPDVDAAGHVVFGGHGDGGHGAEGGEDIHVMPGETERIHVTLEPGRYVLVCSYAGHYQAGQHASLKVVR